MSRGTYRRLSVKLASGPDRPVRVCGVCGWEGEVNDVQSPYLGCNGDPAQHTRATHTIGTGAR